MTPDRLAALRAFFAKNEGRMPEVVTLTYDGLFEANPEAASLFISDLREQQLLFIQKLQSIIRLTRSSQLWPAGAATGQTVIPEVAEFGRSHAKAGVTIEHFAVMGKFMARACKEIAPEEFTPEVAEALAFIFDVLAQSLSTPESAAASILATLPFQTAAPLLDPSAYFDETPAAESAAWQPITPAFEM